YRPARDASYPSDQSSSEVLGAHPAACGRRRSSRGIPSYPRRARRNRTRAKELAPRSSGVAGATASSCPRSVETRPTSGDLELVASILCPGIFVMSIRDRTAFTEADSLDAGRRNSTFG